MNSTNLLDYIAGEENWSFRSFPIPAGTNLLEWLYSKDSTDDFPTGQDKGWLDQIVYSAGSSFASNTTRMTNSHFQFQFNGLAGASYTLQV